MGEPEKKVGPGYIRSNAARNVRLMAFQTSYEPRGYELAREHKAALDALVSFVSQTTSFRVQMIGFASKVGDHAKNKTLSLNRALAVEKYLVSKNPLFAARLEYFEGRGDEGYRADAKDNSSDMRAVEVHLFLGDIDPPPPSNVHPKPPPPPLPGEERTLDWSVAAPGGGSAMLVPGVIIGFNVFFIRHEPTKELRGYIAPQGGVGFSFSGPSKGVVKLILSTLAGGPSFSGLTFEGTKSKLPFNWKELEASFVSVVSAGAGVVVGVAAAHVIFESEVTQRGLSGQIIKSPQRLFDFDSVGKDFQFGAGFSAVTGRLIRVGD